jgi:hypothetical protein
MSARCGSQCNCNKKGASLRRLEDELLPWRRSRVQVGQNLGYANAVLLPILALDRLHLVLQAQFQLLQTDFL